MQKVGSSQYHTSTENLTKETKIQQTRVKLIKKKNEEEEIMVTNKLDQHIPTEKKKYHLFIILLGSQESELKHFQKSNVLPQNSNINMLQNKPIYFPRFQHYLFN